MAVPICVASPSSIRTDSRPDRSGTALVGCRFWEWKKRGRKTVAVPISRYRSTPSRYTYDNQRISPVTPSSARVEL